MSVSPEIAKLFDLSSKVAVVTGAANGIGQEISRLFVLAGAKVVAADIDGKGASAFASEYSDSARAACFDQSNPPSIKSLFDSVRDIEGRVDVLVNCAGIFQFKPFEDVDTAQIDRLYSINLRGPFQCTQHAVTMMKASGSGGSIINISSVNSLRACIYDNVHYGITKAGLDNLTISAALEFATFNIRVNSILPGGVRTNHADASMANYPLRGPMQQPGRIPLSNDLCAPNQIANAALYLASHASAYVTGQLLAVDGGFLVS